MRPNKCTVLKEFYRRTIIKNSLLLQSCMFLVVTVSSLKKINIFSCDYFARWRGLTSPSQTLKTLWSEEPDSRDTVTTSFPVPPFQSTLTSLVREDVQVDPNSRLSAWLRHLVPVIVCSRPFVLIFPCRLVQRLSLQVTFLQNDFHSHLKGQLSFCLPASLEG